MSVQARVLGQAQVVKSGLEASECEDWLALSTEGRRYAVADGASEGVYAGRWARAIAETFVKGDWLPDGDALVQRARDAFWAGVDLVGMDCYRKLRLAKGTYAAFVGVCLEDRSEGQGVAVWGVGDSCVGCVWPDGEGLVFPPRGWRFGTDPVLVCSLRDESVRGAPEPSALGIWRLPVTVVLMTDAVGAWCARAGADGAAPLAFLVEQVTGGNAEEWLREAVAAGNISNDDLTILALRVSMEG